MKNSTAFVFMLAGVAAGLVLGILMAPAPGKETRSCLLKSADQLRKKMHLTGEDEFSASEMEMDATNGQRWI